MLAPALLLAALAADPAAPVSPTGLPKEETYCLATGSCVPKPNPWRERAAPGAMFLSVGLVALGVVLRRRTDAVPR